MCNRRSTHKWIWQKAGDRSGSLPFPLLPSRFIQLLRLLWSRGRSDFYLWLDDSCFDTTAWLTGLSMSSRTWSAKISHRNGCMSEVWRQEITNVHGANWKPIREVGAEEKMCQREDCPCRTGSNTSDSREDCPCRSGSNTSDSLEDCPCRTGPNTSDSH